VDVPALLSQRPDAPRKRRFCEHCWPQRNGAPTAIRPALEYAREPNFMYQRRGNTVTGACELRLWKMADGRWLALCTDPGDDYSGLSIRAGGALAATKILHRLFEKDPERLVFVTHDRPRYRRQVEEFFLARLEWDPAAERYGAPSWRQMARRDFEELIGGPFVDVID
jgi:hypothetical protein